ncbi:MAG: hypothetical protein GYB20_12615 [Oceanospirillales bacterium]|nr:hypothetical protein [Oceanospirillales bacterium]MBR9888519.1 hypothetical protein [Oceanospirillales bacterium]
MMKKIFPLLVALFIGAQASAGELSQPTGAVILTVSGKISNTNAEGEARFDREMLESLGMHMTRTRTPWTAGVGVFEGPLGKTLLETVGASGETLKVTALNGFSSTVPVADFYADDVIFAMKLDGQNMRVRDKGPLFIIYPFDDNDNLSTEVVYNRSVWQISSVDVQ